MEVAKEKELFNTLSPRALNQYKSYYTKFIHWSIKKKHFIDQDLNLQDDSDLVSIYKHIDVSPYRLHWFIIDTFYKQGEEDNAIYDFPATGTIRKIIVALRFFIKLIKIYDNSSAEKYFPDQVRDEESTLVDGNEYLENLCKLIDHYNKNQSGLQIYSNSIANSNVTANIPSLLKISLNFWNDNIHELNQKIFKSDLEKLRFLADFQINAYLNLSFNDRSAIKLVDIYSTEKNNLIFNIYSNQHLAGNAPHQISKNILLANENPFICPLTSLAVYMFLRFYGSTPTAKSMGFPDLLNKSTQNKNINWEELPLIRGRNYLDYPKETSLALYYHTAFNYCHIPYKKMNHFQTKLLTPINLSNKNKQSINFPSIDSTELNAFFTGLDDSTSFPNNIPIDYTLILNKTTSTVINDSSPLPMELLYQIFPEIEIYRKHSLKDKLNEHQLNFLNVMETLRFNLLKNLPFIFKLFPNHDIFTHPVFQQSDFEKFFNDCLKFNSSNTLETSILPFPILPGIDSRLFDTSDIYEILIEPPQFEKTKIKNGTTTHSNLETIKLESNTVSTQQILNESLNLIKSQSVSNVTFLIDTISKLLLKDGNNNMEHFVEKLNVLKNSFLKHLTSPNNTKVKDEKVKVKKRSSVRPIKLLSLDSSSEEEMDDIEETNHESEALLIKIINQFEIENESTNESSNENVNENESDDDNTDEDPNVMQQELNQMIDTMVNERIQITMVKQFEDFEKTFINLVEDLITEKFNNELNQKIEEKINLIIDKKINKKFEDIIKNTQTNLSDEEDVDVTINSIRKRSLPDEESDNYDNYDNYNNNDDNDNDDDNDDDDINFNQNHDDTHESPKKKIKKNLQDDKTKGLLIESDSNTPLKSNVAKSSEIQQPTSEPPVTTSESQLNASRPQIITSEPLRAASEPSRAASEHFANISKTLDNDHVEITNNGDLENLTTMDERNNATNINISRYAPTEPPPQRTVQTNTSEFPFAMNPTFDTVQEVVDEWLIPNPEMGNQCVSTMNKQYGKKWRLDFKDIFKQRKYIVEFYVFLVNKKHKRFAEAVRLCELIRSTFNKEGNILDSSLSSFANKLKQWKAEHNQSYEGLLETVAQP
ncbi:hypothetical protein TBLA_0D02880 [Henningerozyma blattae CBS 6284]|uniref:Transcription activator GCR1-like domain-containing protein n=1 Tax=Henningerozyma blattae (strain ATCC 34711 / CBS 6284 / DSM 70876 / NBRC 10599 / NRRL Y-10934 / UCD 77-7) TaxID=1071380 RepID=I2H337_HENB6|nr:hypothetical protein TBLA_0D02880 [Tetrapisispora blattae CBS 6284]CCH60789.1 hypothetical protein TBLA_0D02880 [Tetrapisispora blattae CBS 6284]